MRFTGLLTIPGILVAVGMVSGADAAGRNTCDARIFQGEERACYQTADGRTLDFRRPMEEALAVADEEAEANGFFGNGMVCGCQLGTPQDVICAGLSFALTGRPNGSGKRLVAETFRARGILLAESSREAVQGAVGVPVEQERFTALRVDASTCLIND